MTARLHELSLKTISDTALRLAVSLVERRDRGDFKTTNEETISIYGIPRGGLCAAYALCAASALFKMVARPEDADVLVDDIIDSGKTFKQYHHPGKQHFAALYSKYAHSADAPITVGDAIMDEKAWVVFPWEKNEAPGEDIITRLLQFIGEDARREGLKETPSRVLSAWKTWTSGYAVEPASVLKVFEDGAEKYDEMLVQRDIPVYSHCEHHLAPFFGVAHIAYIPNGKIVGLSKLSRLVDIFSRRLQVQERLTTQIAGALEDHLDPRGVGVVIEARHMCMESRGIQRAGATTTTSALRGLLKEHQARAEFLALLRKG